MRRSSRRTASPRDIAVFWVTIGGLALVLGAGGFAVGKYLIGGMIRRNEVDQGAPEIVVQDPDAKLGDTTAPEGPPPREAVVKVTERAATEAERAELELQQPQDGAQLNAETNGANPPDSSVGPDDKPLDTDTASPGSTGKARAGTKLDDKAGKPGGTSKPGAYSVVAGSFADPSNADAEITRLTAQGYKPYIVKSKRDGRTFHRVCVGSFADQRAAARLRDKLTEDGTPASLSRD
jgi:cell division septation protein DedD